MLTMPEVTIKGQGQKPQGQGQKHQCQQLI